MFSIVIPSWNNLAFLQLCIASIRKYSQHAHQIIVHVNEGSDGTREWLLQESIEHTASQTNIGICQAVNQAAMRAKQSYIVYLNDDMVCCPGWDTALLKHIQQFSDKAWMLSSTMIEPRETGNACVVVRDFGTEIHDFQEAELHAALPQLYKPDWYGSTWPPTVVHRDWWHKVGGYSLEFSPGMSSDNDFSMKLWNAGCRIFVGVGDSLVYHFQSKSTGKIRKNNGRQQFLNKWGMTQSVFDRFYLRRGVPIGKRNIALKEPEMTLRLRYELCRSRLKRFLTQRK